MYSSIGDTTTGSVVDFSSATTISGSKFAIHQMISSTEMK
jgi:hypothetical protein